MTEEQRERLKQIRERHQVATFAYKGDKPPIAVSDIDFLLSLLDSDSQAAEASPIDMMLFCPRCGTQHVDAPEDDTSFRHRMEAWSLNAEWQDRTPQRWTNPPHKSHLCHNCFAVWRPADVPTNGVARITTRGSEDNTWTNSVVVPAASPALKEEEAQRRQAAIALLDEWMKQPVTEDDSFGNEMRRRIDENRLSDRKFWPELARQDDKLVDEVQHRMDQVVEAAVGWHQAGREGGEWFEAAEKLGAAIDSLLELRDSPNECFCGTELEAGICPNGHDPITPPLRPAPLVSDCDPEG